MDEEIIAGLIEKKNMQNKSRLSSSADYAVVYFYRPKVYVGSLIGYKVRIDDETVIGRVRNGEKFEYKIKEFGKHKFWAKTESKTSVFIDVERGQEYFVRCGINMGIVVGKPEMFVVENELGISEFSELSIE